MKACVVLHNFTSEKLTISRACSGATENFVENSCQKTLFFWGGGYEKDKCTTLKANN